MIPQPGSATLTVVLLLFVGITGAFHILLIWVFPLAERGWKRADYVWLTLAMFGLVGASGEVRRIWAEGQASTGKQLAQNTFDDIKRTSRFGNTYHCMKFNRSAFSPPNLDWVQEQYDATCGWFRRFDDSLPIVQPDAEPIRIDEIMAVPSNVTEEICRRNINEALALVKEYNQKWDQLHQSKVDGKRSDLDLTFVVLGPYLLVIGLALRITKVSGELRLMKAKGDSGNRLTADSNKHSRV